jgi:hypothetical protein
VFAFRSPARPDESAIIRYEMSKVIAPKTKPAKGARQKSARITLSTRRRRRSKSEDRLDGTAAMKALKESSERIPYPARRGIRSPLATSRSD